jgi:hypothetical protein
MRTTTIPSPVEVDEDHAPYLEALAPAFVAELWDLCAELDDD